jgi:hypothetical protein
VDQGVGIPGTPDPLPPAELFGNIPPGTPEPTSWPLQNPVLYTLIWVAIIIAIFAPLSVRQYKRAARR